MSRLPDPGAVSVECNGKEFTALRVTGPDTIEIDADVADHLVRIATGYHGGETPPGAQAGERPAGSVRTKTLYVPSAPAGGSCCPP